MREIMSLGYVVVSGSDLDAWSTFGREGLGLQRTPAPSADADTLYFRLDDRSWRFAVERGEDAGLVALGFEVGSDADLTRLAGRLEAAGVSTKESPDLAAKRRVGRLVRASDPSGVPLEFFCGASIAKDVFVSPTGARFVTGGQGVGHVVVSVDELPASHAFYQEILGFRLSDIILFGGMFEIYFTSPNRRHHSLAYVSPPGAPGGHLEHLMFEVDDLDIVGRAQDYCLDNGVGMRSLLGKHTNDHMVSFYCISPSGLAIEYGWGGRQIDEESHQVNRYDHSSIWGHRPADGRSVDDVIREMLGAAAEAQR